MNRANWPASVWCYVLQQLMGNEHHLSQIYVKVDSPDHIQEVLSRLRAKMPAYPRSRGSVLRWPLYSHAGRSDSLIDGTPLLPRLLQSLPGAAPRSDGSSPARTAAKNAREKTYCPAFAESRRRNISFSKSASLPPLNPTCLDCQTPCGSTTHVCGMAKPSSRLTTVEKAGSTGKV